MSRTIPQKDTRTKVSFFAPTCRWMLLFSQLSTAGLSWPINLSNMRTCFLVRPIATVQPHDSAQCPCGGTAKNCDDNKYLKRIAWMQQTQNGHNHLTPARRTETRTLHTRWQRNNPHSPTALALTNNTKTSWSTPTTPRDSRVRSFTPNLNRISTKKTKKKMCDGRSTPNQTLGIIFPSDAWTPCWDWQMLNTIAGENRHRPTVSTR